MRQLKALLEEHGEAIVSECAAALDVAHLEHYEVSGPLTNEQRFHQTLGFIIEALDAADAEPIVARALKIARERFSEGYEVREVLTAFNVLEEVVWRWALAVMPAEQAIRATGLLRTIIDLLKDNLAETYVALALKGATTGSR